MAVFHCSFNLHFLDDYWSWAIFHMLIGHLPIPPCEVPAQDFVHLFYLSFSYWFLGFLYIFWIHVFWQIDAYLLLFSNFHSHLWCPLMNRISYFKAIVIFFFNFSSRFFFAPCLRNICLPQCHEEIFLCYILEFTFYS